MTDKEQREVFAKNLVDILEEQNRTQKEVADALDVSPQVVNTWCKGIALPRAGKVQRLASHLDVPISRLLNPAVCDEISRLSSDEMDLIRVYRTLDASGRDVVKSLLDSLEKKSDVSTGSEVKKDVG